MTETMPEQIAVLFANLLTLKRKDIAGIIPKIPGCNPVVSLKVLFIIKAKPRQPIYKIRLLCGSTSLNIDSNVKQLIDLGYVTTVSNSYWNTSIHAWKVTQVHVMTQKGDKILLDLLELLRVNLEINHALAS